MEKEALARFLAASRTYLGLPYRSTGHPVTFACMTTGSDRLPVYAAVYPLSMMGVEQ